MAHYQKIIVMLLSALMLSACSEEVVVKVPTDKPEYIGVWQYKHDEFSNGVKVDNRLFAIYEDSTVSYKRCSKAQSSHTTVNAPEGVISKFSDNEIVVAAKVLFMSFDLDFVIDKVPYLDSGRWYMQMDGVLYTKLKEGEKSDHEHWDCGDN